MSDPAKYRSKEEVEEVREKNDPITLFRTYMVDTLKIPEDDLKKIDDQVKTTMVEVVEFAQSSPEPDPSELYTEVFQEGGAL